MVSLEDIRAAERTIASSIIRTPLVFSPTLSAMTGANVYLKLETLQKAGSFKVRGALNKILSRHNSLLDQGVIAASAGNHAQGVAVAAHSAGIPATIVMPEWASLSKQEATRSYGARVIIAGKTLEESIEKAQEIARGGGGLFIHPFDDDEIIAGQGTIALEIFADLPNTDMIVVPVGGGGLIAGIATAAKSIHPEIVVVGVQAASCPSAMKGSGMFEPACITQHRTIADGIRVAESGVRTLPVIRELVDRIVLASEDEIADAMLLLLERKHIIAEGAGAVPLAAMLNGSIAVRAGSNIVLVISGGNVDSALLFRIVRQALIRHGRIMRFSVLLDDNPGALTRLLGVIAEQQGNILHVHHTLGESDIPVLMAHVQIELETRGHDHIKEIEKALHGQGYEIQRG
jgi:threonine dehydratase